MKSNKVMNNKALAEFIADHYKFKNMTSDAILMDEGINKHYKIFTKEAIYSAKLIDINTYEKNYNISDNELFFSLQLSEKIATLMKNKQIPAVPAIDSIDGPVLRHNNFLIILYPFVPGYVLKPFNNSEVHVKNIASTLAAIHQLGLKDFDGSPIQNRWMAQINTITNLIISAPWLTLLEVDIDVNTKARLQKLIAFIHQSIQESIANILKSNHIVITHNDIKPKNVIWSDLNKPNIIDWESAGYMVRSVDFLDTLIVWCLEKDDHCLIPNNKKVRTFMEAYHKNSLLVKIDLNTIYIVAVKWIAWLAICSNSVLRDSNQHRDINILNEPLEMIEFLQRHKSTLLALS